MSHISSDIILSSFTMAQKCVEMVDEMRPVSEWSSDEEEEVSERNSSLDKFNVSYDNDKEYWRNQSETLDEEEWEKLMQETVLKKKVDMEKFQEIFQRESEFWRQASTSLDDNKYEKLVEEECLAEPFYACHQLDIDFQPFLQLFKKGDKFWKLARKNLKDEEFEKLVQIYIASEKITWNNLTSDAFMGPPPTAQIKKENDEGGRNTSGDATAEDEGEVKPFICDSCPKAFKLAKQLRIHKDFNHSHDKPLTCNFCHRHFKQFDALQKHRQIHI